MRTLTAVFVALFVLVGLAAAASIDGKWVSERKMERNGESFTIKQTFDLKSEGNKLTGAVTMQFGDREPRKAEIKDGKIDGDKFSFSTTMSGPNGDMTTTYEGTVSGDTLKGTAARNGGEGRPFEAKKE